MGVANLADCFTSNGRRNKEMGRVIPGTKSCNISKCSVADGVGVMARTMLHVSIRALRTAHIGTGACSFDSQLNKWPSMKPNDRLNYFAQLTFEPYWRWFVTTVTDFTDGAGVCEAYAHARRSTAAAPGSDTVSLSQNWQRSRKPDAITCVPSKKTPSVFDFDPSHPFNKLLDLGWCTQRLKALLRIQLQNEVTSIDSLYYAVQLYRYADGRPAMAQKKVKL